MNTYTLQDVINNIATVWDKLTNKQKRSITKMISNAKEQDNTPLKNQITIDEFLAEIEEDYRRKNIQCE